MKSLHGVIHDKLWVRFHGLLQFASDEEVGLTQILRDHDFINIFSSKTYCRAYSNIDSMIDKHHQVILSN